MKTRPRGQHIDTACAIERLDRRMLLSALVDPDATDRISARELRDGLGGGTLTTDGEMTL